MKRVITSLVVFYLSIAAILYFNQQRFIYYPANALELTTPNEQRVFQVNKQTIVCQTANITLPKAHDKTALKSKSALLYFGGNAELVNKNHAHFSQHLSEHDIYLFNYRGYGGSSGEPSEQGIYADALAVFDILSTEYDQISLMGRSLGSGVATYVASQRKISHLVLITPFDSIENVAQQRLPFFPMSLLLTEKYDSVSRVPLIQSPVLVLSAEHDAIIPWQRTKSLIDTFDSQLIKTVKVPNTNHNNISIGEGYYQSISLFLNNE